MDQCLCYAWYPLRTTVSRTLASGIALVVSYLVGSVVAHRVLFGDFPGVDTQWVGQARQLLGPTRSM